MTRLLRVERLGVGGVPNIPGLELTCGKPTGSPQPGILRAAFTAAGAPVPVTPDGVAQIGGGVPAAG